MDLNKYQEQAIQYAAYNDSEYAFLALSEEVGEVLGKLAKHVRKNGKSVGISLVYARSNINEGSKLKEDLIKELGDVLWQLQACCHELGTDLNTIAQLNLEKLSGRSERGTIVGEGDDR